METLKSNLFFVFHFFVCLDLQKQNLPQAELVDQQKFYLKQRKDKAMDDLFQLGMKISDLKLSVAKGEITQEQAADYAKNLMMMLDKSGKVDELFAANESGVKFVWGMLSEVSKSKQADKSGKETENGSVERA